jgi:hypothetical protein
MYVRLDRIDHIEIANLPTLIPSLWLSLQIALLSPECESEV